MKSPNIRTLESVMEDIDENEVFIDDRWITARPQTTPESLRNRVRAAWLVLTGRADALIWPGGQ